MSTRADRRAGRAAKRYVPKPVHVNAVERAITGAAKINPAQVAQTRAALTQTFTAFGQGFDCAGHWRSMADALNVAEQLARLGICSDASSVERITEAQAVLTAVADRHAATGSWTLRSAERAALETGCGCMACSLSTAATANTSTPWLAACGSPPRPWPAMWHPGCALWCRPLACNKPRRSRLEPSKSSRDDPGDAL